MRTWPEFVQSQIDRGARQVGGMNCPVVAGYGELESEYRALVNGPAIVDRSYRGLIEVGGRDRAIWLHNLLTNNIKPLGRGDGVYAFALSVQGRILFDLNVLVLGESIWLDIDRRFLPVAMTHFRKYHIVEDIRLTDRSDDYSRFGLVGVAASGLAAGLGAAQAAKMPVLGITSALWQARPLTLVRHDFCGPFGVELYVPADSAVTLWEDLTAADRPQPVIPVGDEAVQVHRIEAGIPWSGREITEEYLSAETGQLPRAVSFNKGCYLGQEIVERMRSRGVVARRLCGLECNGDAVPPAGSKLADEAGKPIGTVTSACRSIAKGRPIVMGYVKSAASSAGLSASIHWDAGSTTGTIVNLPFTSRPE